MNICFFFFFFKFQIKNIYLLFSFNNNLEDLILFGRLNFVVFQIGPHATFLTYDTYQMCIRPIMCRSQILLNWVTFFLKINLMIIYFTINFDVYKCPHFKIHALQCIWWVLKLLFKIFLFKLIFLIGSFLFKISLSYFSKILFYFISFFPFGIKWRFWVNRKVSIFTIHFSFPSNVCIYIYI